MLRYYYANRYNYMKEHNLTEFVMPHDEIKAMNTQLQNISEIADWFAYGIAFISYELRYTTKAGKLMLDQFDRAHSTYSIDTIISLKANEQGFHSCMRTKKGVFWILPVFSIPRSKLTLGVTEIAAYINFDVNRDPSIWYVIVFKYNITKNALPKEKGIINS